MCESLGNLLFTTSTLGDQHLLDDWLCHLEGLSPAVDTTDSEEKDDDDEKVEERESHLSEVSPEAPFVDRFDEVGVEGNKCPKCSLHEMSPVVVLGVDEHLHHRKQRKPDGRENLEEETHTERGAGDDQIGEEGQDVGFNVHCKSPCQRTGYSYHDVGRVAFLASTYYNM